MSLWGADSLTDGVLIDAGLTSSGILVNGARGGTGMRGSGLFFDGVDDRVRIPFSPAFTPTNYTVALWVQPLAPVQDSPLQEVLIGQPFGAPQLVVRPGAEGLRISSGFRKGRLEDPISFEELVTDSSIPFSRYTHVATTWDGTRLRIYLDGQLVQEGQTCSCPVVL